VLGVSAFYLLKGKHVGVAKRSMTVAAAFGLASSLSVVVLGDESGYALTDNQKMKLAALEAMWETEPAPGRPDRLRHSQPEGPHRPTPSVKIPWVMGLIATRSLNKPVEGIFELVATGRDAHRVRRHRL
jgi:cytochrome d ubiquinol oxidase subunit I